MKHVTILGGGPAGLAVAYYAHKKGIPYRLFEKSDHLGGLCRTLRSGQHRYDTGAHRLHDRDPEVTRDLKALLGNRLQAVDSPSKIYFEGRFIDFPPTPLNMLFSSGFRDLGRIALDIVRARSRRHEIRSFEDFAVGNFGRTLAERFLLGYSEKVWGLPCDRLSPDIATRRLSGMSPGSLILELFLPSRKTHHIDGAFLYPKGGFGEICDSLAGSLRPEWLTTGSEVTGVETKGGQLTSILIDHGRARFDVPDRVVSTLPLTNLVSLLKGTLPDSAVAAARQLRFRHVRILFIRLDKESVTPNASTYFPDASLCMSRASEPRNRSSAMSPRGETSLIVEVPCSTGDRLQELTDEDLLRLVRNDLSRTGLLNGDQILEWRHHFAAHAYPIYSIDYRDHVASIRKGVDRIGNLETLGRTGRFFYSHLHDQMRFGKDYITSISG